jgi:hypothetical protein
MVSKPKSKMDRIRLSNSFDVIGNLEKEMEEDIEVRLRTTTTFLEAFEKVVSSRDKGKGKLNASPTDRGLFSSGWAMKLLSWNVRGLNMPLKQKEVRKVVRRLNLSIVCLVETRVKVDNFPRIVASMLPGWKVINDYSQHYLGKIWICCLMIYMSKLLLEKLYLRILAFPGCCLVSMNQILGPKEGSCCRNCS